jgi:hypothetical protein
MSRKHGHWGFTEEAKAWATRARRRDEKEELGDALASALDETGAGDSEPCRGGRRRDRLVLLGGAGAGEAVGVGAGLDDVAAKVRRSTMAAQSRGSVKVRVQPSGTGTCSLCGPR